MSGHPLGTNQSVMNVPSLTLKKLQ